MSFGKWYEEKKAEEAQAATAINGGSGSGRSNSWFETEGLPLFNVNSDSMQHLSWSSMKASMEAQMPSKILGMGYQQRFQVFCALLFLSVLFFALAFFVGLPMMAARPQKFALSFTMGSLMFMGSFGILKGPFNHAMSMIQSDRLAFTTMYVGSMLLTLYFTFYWGGPTGYLCVLGASVGQLVALAWYLISFLPGGSSGLSYVIAAIAHLLKPVIVACAKLQAMCVAKCFGWMISSSPSTGSSLS